MIERLTGLQTAALPSLLQSVAGDDETAVANSGAALAAFAQSWGPDHAQTTRLVELLTERFAGCFTDYRAAELVEHTVPSLVRQRRPRIVLDAPRIGAQSCD